MTYTFFSSANFFVYGRRHRTWKLFDHIHYLVHYHDTVHTASAATCNLCSYLLISLWCTYLHTHTKMTSKFRHPNISSRAIYSSSVCHLIPWCGGKVIVEEALPMTHPMVYWGNQKNGHNPLESIYFPSAHFVIGPAALSLFWSRDSYQLIHTSQSDTLLIAAASNRFGGDVCGCCVDTIWGPVWSPVVIFDTWGKRNPHATWGTVGILERRDLQQKCKKRPYVLCSPNHYQCTTQFCFTTSKGLQVGCPFERNTDKN